MHSYANQSERPAESSSSHTTVTFGHRDAAVSVLLKNATASEGRVSGITVKANTVHAQQRGDKRYMR